MLSQEGEAEKSEARPFSARHRRAFLINKATARHGGPVQRRKGSPCPCSGLSGLNPPRRPGRGPLGLSSYPTQALQCAAADRSAPQQLCVRRCRRRPLRRTARRCQGWRRGACGWLLRSDSCACGGEPAACRLQGHRRCAARGTISVVPPGLAALLLRHSSHQALPPTPPSWFCLHRRHLLPSQRSFRRRHRSRRGARGGQLCQEAGPAGGQRGSKPQGGWGG